MQARYKLFCQEYIIDLNATQAAIRAGYSKRTANEIAVSIMKRPEVREYIDELITIRARELELDAAWVLRKFYEIAERCMQAEPVMVNNGLGWVETGEYKFDSQGAIKAIENIAKHIGFYERDNNQSKPQLNLNINNIDIREISRRLDEEY